MHMKAPEHKSRRRQRIADGRLNNERGFKLLQGAARHARSAVCLLSTGDKQTAVSRSRLAWPTLPKAMPFRYFEATIAVGRQFVPMLHSFCVHTDVCNYYAHANNATTQC